MNVITREPTGRHQAAAAGHRMWAGFIAISRYPLVRLAVALPMLSPIWFVQYLFVVPAVVLYRMAVAVVKFALKAGAVAILLLFLPVIGWLILLLWLLFRRPDHSAEILAELRRRNDADLGPSVTPRRSLLRPWLAGPVMRFAQHA